MSSVFLDPIGVMAIKLKGEKLPVKDSILLGASDVFQTVVMFRPRMSLLKFSTHRWKIRPVLRDQESARQSNWWKRSRVVWIQTSWRWLHGDFGREVSNCSVWYCKKWSQSCMARSRGAIEQASDCMCLMKFISSEIEPLAESVTMVTNHTISSSMVSKCKHSLRKSD